MRGQSSSCRSSLFLASYKDGVGTQCSGGESSNSLARHLTAEGSIVHRISYSKTVDTTLRAIKIPYHFFYTFIRLRSSIKMPKSEVLRHALHLPQLGRVKQVSTDLWILKGLVKAKRVKIYHFEVIVLDSEASPEYLLTENRDDPC